MLPRLLMGNKGGPPHKKWFPQLHIAAEPGIGRVQPHLARQFMAVKRQPRLRAQAVPRCQATWLHAHRPTHLQNSVPQLRRFVRVYKQFIRHPLAGIASAGNDDIHARQVALGQTCPA